MSPGHLLYVDGRELRYGRLDEYLSVTEIEGIEVYRGRAAPSTYRGTWGCGAILVWRRPQPQPEFAFDWGRSLMFLGIAGAATLVLTVF